MTEAEALERGVWEGAGQWEKNTPTRADKDYSFRPDTLLIDGSELARRGYAGSELLPSYKRKMAQGKEEDGRAVFQPAKTMNEAREYALANIAGKLINVPVRNSGEALTVLNRVNEYVAGTSSSLDSRNSRSFRRCAAGKLSPRPYITHRRKRLGSDIPPKNGVTPNPSMRTPSNHIRRLDGFVTSPYPEPRTCCSTSLTTSLGMFCSGPVASNENDTETFLRLRHKG